MRQLFSGLSGGVGAIPELEIGKIGSHSPGLGAHFAVLPFSRTEDGDFLAEAAVEVRSAVEARATAARIERGADCAKAAKAASASGHERRGWPSPFA
jgi:hypothetical protein